MGWSSPAARGYLAAEFSGYADFRTIGGAELSFNHARLRGDWMLDDANVPGRLSTTETQLLGDAALSLAGADIRSFGVDFEQLLVHSEQLWGARNHRLFFERCVDHLRRGGSVDAYLRDPRLRDAKWDDQGLNRVTDPAEVKRRATDLCVSRAVDEFSRLRDTFDGRSLSDESDWAYWHLRHYGKSRRKKREGNGVPAGIRVERSTEPGGSDALRVRVPWRLQRPDDGLNLTGWTVAAAVVLGMLEFDFPKLVSIGVAVLLLLLLSGLRRVNETSISVRSTMIRISHGPVPWPGQRFDPRHIEQLYVARRPIAQHIFDYCVRARLDDDRDVSFFTGLTEPAVAFYLEHCIEQHFNIQDRSVRGEYLGTPATVDAEAAAEHLGE